MRGWIVTGATLIGVLCGCYTDNSGSSSFTPGEVIATSGVPSVSASPPPQQNAVIGATIRATTEVTTIDASGNPSFAPGTAAYTVANLQPIAQTNSYTEVTGTLYSVDVTVQTISGVVTVHPWSFALRTSDGTNLTPDLNAVSNGLPATDLPQGQKVSGPIAVDVPPGKSITEIVLTDGYGGRQLGRWTVA
ncbi:immunogenic protein MPT63 [Mycolicibacterium flavescens]|uniref:DUF1942 domain-containing protein n=1 Tax=Mycobacterium neumannii TaxID=2048551 RepID=UPI000B93EC99|nr:DUF1942 domain-containing protein [Mycobacterium neumannii]VEG39408.1 immunogenic protein MPT63 [Mycolicibacterium flavescens]